MVSVDWHAVSLLNCSVFFEISAPKPELVIILFHLKSIQKIKVLIGKT